MSEPTTNTVRVVILDSTGDTELCCAATDVEQLAGIQAQFDELLGKGYVAFVTEVEGGSSVPTRALVPGAFEHLVFRQGYGG